VPAVVVVAGASAAGAWLFAAPAFAFPAMFGALALVLAGGVTLSFACAGTAAGVAVVTGVEVASPLFFFDDVQSKARQLMHSPSGPTRTQSRSRANGNGRKLGT